MAAKLWFEAEHKTEWRELTDLYQSRLCHQAQVKLTASAKSEALEEAADELATAGASNAYANGVQSWLRRRASELRKKA